MRTQSTNKDIRNTAVLSMFVAPASFVFTICVVCVLTTDSQSQTTSIYCEQPDGIRWNGFGDQWQKPRQPIHRHLTFQFDSTRVRARVRYIDKWYAWTQAEIQNDLILWSYTEQYRYTYYRVVHTTVEQQGSLFLRFPNCRKTGEQDAKAMPNSKGN